MREHLENASLSLRSHWMQYSRGLGSSPLPDHVENLEEEEGLSILIHRTQVRRAMYKLPVQEKQPFTSML